MCGREKFGVGVVRAKLSPLSMCYFVIVWMGSPYKSLLIRTIEELAKWKEAGMVGIKVAPITVIHGN